MDLSTARKIASCRSTVVHVLSLKHDGPFRHVVKHGVESGVFFGVEFGVSFGVEFGVIIGVKFGVSYIYITIQNRHKK